MVAVRGLAVLGCFILLIASGTAESQPAAKLLFDGRSLTGWEGDPQHWRVEDGAIVGKIPVGQSLAKNTWLVWRGGELKDFDLRLQFRLSGKPAANSGVQFRCQVDHVDHVSGYQADLDMGATWLGRIYDEHGRQLLVERGQRVHIDPAGQRSESTFAPAQQYAVLFRENAWNDYRIVAIGERIAVFVNGTLFSELIDQQTGERDLQGSLALQLHSGPETRIEFRDIRLEELSADDDRLGAFPMPPADQQQHEKAEQEAAGIPAVSLQGEALNLGFEKGDLSDWTATGDAFQKQPVSQDGISTRWPDQSSGKVGRFFIGGYEIVQDVGRGTLTSAPFKVTHPFASFLFAAGDTDSTRVEIIEPAADGESPTVLFTSVGQQREQMSRVAVDLREHQGRTVAVRLVDESAGAWGHLNFDDFVFHVERPAFDVTASTWRSTANPLLQHLVANPPQDTDPTAPVSKTLQQMHVPPGFSVDLLAAEPAVHQPMAFTFDAKGRLWVVEGHCYPTRRAEGEGLDRILIFADQDGDGRFESRKVFIEGLNLVSGMQVGHQGVWVGAAPHLLFIPDRDGDDQPDGEPEVLLDGFGFGDTHETLNNFIWGPDGWLYGNQGIFNESLVGKPGADDSHRTRLTAGVWRYHPTRHQFEVFAHGGSNQWGLDFDDFGQLFMTHCRSAWGGGLTTHVVQGGHYWTQTNSDYARFISAEPITGLAHMKNYLLASARYGHGEGGAGKRGSRQVYGGHSHVGTMIYLGDNWPTEYRNHLFTHNLHGHQINHQINLREQGGYNTVHAGYDVLFCADQQYIGVDLQVGPDGAVYISDWYDPRHCHSPHTEQWDRGNGRMYRMKFDASYRPVSVDYTAVSDEELAEAQLHRNDWHVRAARLQLAERAAGRAVSEPAIERLTAMALSHADASRRLRALWALHAAGRLDRVLAGQLLSDDSEYVRAWTVQLAIEALDQDNIAALLTPLVKSESSLLVRRYLASGSQRVDAELAWVILEQLSAQPENGNDRELPSLIWYALADRMDQHLERALALAESSVLPAISDYVYWYAAKSSDAGRQAVAEHLAQAPQRDRAHLLSLFAAGLSGMRGLDKPAAWTAISSSLYDAEDAPLRRAAESVGAAFGDPVLFARMRSTLGDGSADRAVRLHALSLLSRDASAENVPYLLELLDDRALAENAIRMLPQYGHDSIAEALLARLPNWEGTQRQAALEALCSRKSWALALLNAIRDQRIDEGWLTAYYARQMASLNDAEVNERLTEQWGQLGQSSAERQAEIAELVQAYRKAPLWAYNQSAGLQHFNKLCVACHGADEIQQRIGPKLQGSGSKGLEYIVENIVDPNAVVGKSFQASIIQTVDGRILTGLVLMETDTAITLRTTTTTETVAKADVEEITLSSNSFMPQGLLQDLQEREQIELLKYLLTL